MKIEVIEEKENPLLHRKELTIRIKEFEKTPSKEEVKKQAVAKLGSNENKLLLDRITQEYGKQEAIAFVKIYESEEKLKEYESKHKIKRNGMEKKTEEKTEEVKEKKRE